MADQEWTGPAASWGPLFLVSHPMSSIIVLCRDRQPLNSTQLLHGKRRNLPVGDPVDLFVEHEAQPKTTLARYVLTEERRA